MTGLFFENGPYYLNEALELENRTVGHWNKDYNVIYVDQPIGTGYSFAGKNESYTTNEDEVAADLYYFLQHWYKIYPQYTKSSFFITGESYGGHYIPALAAKIIDENELLTANPSATNLFIPLEGVAIGDGLTDPCSQVQTGPRAAYDFGLISGKVFAKAKFLAEQAAFACTMGNFSLAHDYRGQMEDAVSIASGVNVYDVREFGNYDWMHERMDVFLNDPATKVMLHVGDHAFGTHPLVGERLYDDVMRTQADKFPKLLSKIRVLLYQVYCL